MEQNYLIPGVIPPPASIVPQNNAKGVFNTLGARNFAESERQSEDFYATDPVAIEYLMQLESFQHKILEPCCGQGHMAEAIKLHGHEVEAFDLIDRGYGRVQDFLAYDTDATDFDIITNPPYGGVLHFIYKGISLLKGRGQKLALFLRILTLESRARKALFDKYPPVRVWISSSRIQCAKNGQFSDGNTAQAYAWFVWQAGYRGDTTLKWF